MIGPVPWGHSGPLCHALSLLLLSSSSSWTSMRRRRATVAAVATPGEWQCKTARSSEWAQHFSNASCVQYVTCPFRLPECAQVKHSNSGDRIRKHNSRDYNQILLSEKDQQVIFVSCVPRAKSAIYDCLIFLLRKFRVFFLVTFHTIRDGLVSGNA